MDTKPGPSNIVTGLGSSIPDWKAPTLLKLLQGNNCLNEPTQYTDW